MENNDRHSSSSVWLISFCLELMWMLGNSNCGYVVEISMLDAEGGFLIS